MDCCSGRRTLLGAGLCLASPLRLLAQTLTPALAARAPLAFQVWRGGQQIGRHAVSFHGGDQDFTVAILAEMLVKLGPIPVYHYHHQATEVWRGGKFYSLQSQTVATGSRQQVSAVASDNAVVISTQGGHSVRAPADAHPLTHWNPAVLDGPLFNPQTGEMVRERVSRTPDQTAELANGRNIEATRYALVGQADITDWYDEEDVWAALRGKAPDGSYIDYRRVA